MNKFNEDKKIKEIFNIKESVPDNINSIFDDFINKNVKEEKRNNIKVKKENIRKVLSIAASFIIVIVASETIYASITGKSLISLFNINEGEYNNSIISVNKQVSDSDIKVELETYAIDQNAVVVNYKISSDKELNFIDKKDNIVAETQVNKNTHIDIDKQNYLQNDKTYTIATLYSIEKFDSVLDKFELNIKISEIAGIKGEWNFDINLDKSNKKENKISFYDDINLKDTNRIAIKTNYTPISMDVKSVSTSDFSTMMNITIYSVQNGVKQSEKIEHKKDITAMSEEYNNPKWNETENFIFEVKDENENELLFSEYAYTRAEWIKNEKIIFPNLSSEVKKLNFNIYLINENKERELVGKFELDLNKEKDNNKNELDKTDKLENGRIEFKVSSKWNVKKEENLLEMYTNDSYGNPIEIQFYEFSDDKTKELNEKYGRDLEKIASNNESYKHEEKSAENSKIISKGKEKISNFDGYQMTYTTLINSSNSEWATERIKEKDFCFENNEKLYLVSIHASSETAVDNNMAVFYDFIKNIQIK